MLIALATVKKPQNTHNTYYVYPMTRWCYDNEPNQSMRSIRKSETTYIQIEISVGPLFVDSQSNDWTAYLNNTLSTVVVICVCCYWHGKIFRVIVYIAMETRYKTCDQNIKMWLNECHELAETLIPFPTLFQRLHVQQQQQRLLSHKHRRVAAAAASFHF